MICKWILRTGLLGALAGFALATASANDESAVQLLQAIEQKYGKVPSVIGSFTQKMHEPGFGAGKPMQATFALLKPKDFKIDYTTPEPNTTLVTDGHLYKYVPSLKQATRHKLQQSDLHYLALGFGARTSEILSIYDVKNSSNGILLKPKNSKTAQFNSMTIQVDKAELVPEKFTVEQSDGSKIELAINKSSLRFGERLTARDFSPTFPRGVQVVDMD